MPMKLIWKVDHEFANWTERGSLIGKFPCGQNREMSLGSVGGNQLSKELSVSITSPAVSRPVGWVRSAGIVIAGSALLAICSHIALPLYFTPVPLTLQTFAVLLIGLLCSPRLAAGTVIAYLIEGAIGLPVFAPTPVLPGLAHLVGPTGGYLMSYPVAAALTAFLWRRIHRGFAGAAFSAAVGSVIILACGAAWLSAFIHVGAFAVLSSAVLPFIPGDLLKITAAALVACGLRRSRLINI
jgi:biotin transport system substrate-specific component